MVTNQQKRSLEYFKNKIVTFFVSPINRNFDEEQILDYFLGRVTEMDDQGIWFEHVKSKCMNFIFYDKIISISEEKFIPAEDNPTVENKEALDIPAPQNVSELKQLFN
jgi:hypothetical protein